MMEKLPSEIAFEIFYRLPPESIVLCKLVCKSWCSLLPLGDDGNHFANMHLRRQRRNIDYSTLSFIALHEFRVDEEEGSAVGEFGITKYNEVEELNCKVKRLKLSQICRRNGITRLLGSCNGLVCMTRTNYHGSILSFDRICICNPLLHEYVTLPLSDLQFKYDNSRDCDIVFGFGHNPITDEYKVVRVQYRRSEYSVFLIGDVEVYTLGKSNGMWRNKGTIKYHLRGWSRPVHMNGSVHWLARTEEYLERIVSFDLEDEEFRMIPLPAGYLYISERELRELRGYLCLIQESHEMDESFNSHSRILDIWVLKDYMNKESWVKEFKIKWKEQLWCYSPVAIKKKKDGYGDEILLWCGQHDCQRLVSYDPKTQNFEEVVGGRQFVSVPIGYREPLLYINSLVSLKALGEDAKYAENHPKTKA